MYVVGSTLNNSAYQYSLSTAWDVSTASYSSVSSSVASQDGFPQGVTFSPDGTKMYVTGGGNGRIYQYSLSTAWDLSTASYSSVFFSVTSQDTAPAGFTFSPDGIKIYMVGYTNSYNKLDNYERDIPIIRRKNSRNCQNQK